MERLLMDEEERNTRSNTSSSRRRNASGSMGSSHLLRQLVEMGFPPNWCAEALSSTGHNVEEALTWMIRNGERLSALDEGIDNNEEEEDDDFEEDKSGMAIDEECPKVENVEHLEKETVITIGGWRHDVACPLRSISGRVNIDHNTLVVNAPPTGGFSSVGMKGIPLESGKWYYEAELLTDGCLQIGWADSSFSGHCQADRGDGCGDGPSSWAFDGWRRYRWHSSATEWGCRWQKGDIVGCLLDMDKKEIRFTLNGRGEEIGMGLAFSEDGFRPCGGVYACVSFNRKEKLRLILGGEGLNNSFHFPPPPGYLGVGESVIKLVSEREELIENETFLLSSNRVEKMLRKPYLCDFSDGEHGHELFSWQHRYYGADASVHLGGRGNRKKNSKMRKAMDIITPPACDNIDDLYHTTIDARLSKIWKNKDSGRKEKYNDLKIILDEISTAYSKVREDVTKEMRDTNVAICILYARKLILHTMITQSSEFDVSLFRMDADSVDDDKQVAQKLWIVLDKCCSLHATGWVGEAGAMSVTAEALGLAISSNDRTFQNSPFSNILGLNSFKNGQDIEQRPCIPSAAVSQFLSSAKIAHGIECKVIDPSSSLASCAEASLGGDVAGSIIFLRWPLQNAVITSSSMIHVLLAVIRRSVRHLSSVEYGDTPSYSVDSDEDDVSVRDIYI